MTEIEEAQLGLATTEELFREIIARLTNNAVGSDTQWGYTRKALVLAEMLGSLDANTKEYRAVDE